MADTNDTQKSPGGTDAATLGASSGVIGPPGAFPSLLPTADQISTTDTGNVDSGITAVVSECQSVLESANAAINNHVSECLNDCRMGGATCIACILGQIERETGLGQSVIAKCWERIGGKISGALNDSLTLSAKAGMPAPTEAQWTAFLNGQPIPPSESVPSGSISTPSSDTTSSTSPKPVELPTGVTLPDGAALPVQDVATGQILCPDSPPPFRSPNSPTGWLGIQYQPVYGDRGQILWCVPMTHIAEPPSGTASGNTDTTLPPPADTPTLPGGSGSQIPTSTPPQCPEGWQVGLFDTSVNRYMLNGQYIDPSAVGLNPHNTNIPTVSGTFFWVCYEPVNEQPSQPPEEQPPAEQPPEEPINSPPAITTDIGCSPDRLSAWASRLDSFVSGGDGQYSQLFQAFGSGVGLILSSAASKILGISDIGGLGRIFSAAAGAGATDLLKKLILPTAQPGQCSSDAFFASVIADAARTAFGGWFGVVPRQTIQTIEYNNNYICQTLLPSTDQFDLMYRNGYIQESDWTNGVKFNGHCPDWQKIIVNASKNRIGIQDAFRLFKLEKLSDSELLQAWRRQGVDIDNDLAKWNEALIQYPGVADIIRMMVKDIADTDTVDTLGLKYQFGDKWQGFLKQWGNAQGISDDVALAQWMAHWQNPSPGQVYDWLHRLRPDDRDPDDPYKTIAVDKDVAAKLLQIADYIPGLIDNYIATSYRPLTRVDLRRMYAAGTFTTIDPVRRGYRDLGYDSINAERLADFTERITRPQRATLAGEIPSKEIARAYQADLLDTDEARGLLARSGLTDEQIDSTVRATDTRRTIASRKIRFSALRKRYFMGEFTDSDAINELVLASMDVDAAVRTVRLWTDERTAKAKQPTIAMLCKWHTEGLINLDEYYRRVRNLNYSEVDAQRVVQTCLFGIREKQEKDFERNQKRIAAEEKARNRAALIAEKEQRAAIRAEKLKHKLEHKEVTKRDDKGTTVTVTDSVIDKPDDNVTDTTSNVTVTMEGPPSP